MDGNSILKFIGIVLVVAIIASILFSFKSVANYPPLKNLSDTFGNATAALSFASSYWYLFLAAFFIGPFVPSAGKWVAKRFAKIYNDKNLSSADKAALFDAISYTKQLDEKSKTLTPAELEEFKKDFADRFVKEHSQDSRDKAEEYSKDNPAEEIQIPEHRG